MNVWSWVLAGLSVTALWIIGNKRNLGNAFGLLIVQPAWLIYAVVTGQYGFIASSVVFAVVYARNWVRWRREAAVPRRVRTPVRDHTYPPVNTSNISYGYADYRPGDIP